MEKKMKTETKERKSEKKDAYAKSVEFDVVDDMYLALFAQSRNGMSRVYGGRTQKLSSN